MGYQRVPYAISEAPWLVVAGPRPLQDHGLPDYYLMLSKMCFLGFIEGPQAWQKNLGVTHPFTSDNIWREVPETS